MIAAEGLSTSRAKKIKFNNVRAEDYQFLIPLIVNWDLSTFESVYFTECSFYEMDIIVEFFTILLPNVHKSVSFDGVLFYSESELILSSLCYNALEMHGLNGLTQCETNNIVYEPHDYKFQIYSFNMPKYKNDRVKENAIVGWIKACNKAGMFINLNEMII